MIIRNFQQPYFYSKLLGAAQSVRDGRGNRRCNYAGDYKHLRWERVGMKCVSDSAHWIHATMKSSFKVVEMTTGQEEHLVCIGTVARGNAYAFVQNEGFYRIESNRGMDSGEELTWMGIAG